jgi:hypothetical protein
MSRAILERRPTLDELFGPEIEAETEEIRREIDSLIEFETKNLHREAKEASRYFDWPTNLSYVAYGDFLFRYRKLERLKVQRHNFFRDRLGAPIPIRPPVEIKILDGEEVELMEAPLDEATRRAGLAVEKILNIFNFKDTNIEDRANAYYQAMIVINRFLSIIDLPDIKERFCNEERKPIIEVCLFPSFQQWIPAIRASIFDWSGQYEEFRERSLCVLGRIVEWIDNVAKRSVAHCLSAIEAALAMLRVRAPSATLTTSSELTPRELIGELISPRVLAAGSGFGLFVIRC